MARKEKHINDVEQCSISKLVENAWNSFLETIKGNHQMCTYNLRLRPSHWAKQCNNNVLSIYLQVAESNKLSPYTPHYEIYQ